MTAIIVGSNQIIIDWHTAAPLAEMLTFREKCCSEISFQTPAL